MGGFGRAFGTDSRPNEQGMGDCDTSQGRQRFRSLAESVRGGIWKIYVLLYGVFYERNCLPSSYCLSAVTAVDCTQLSTQRCPLQAYAGISQLVEISRKL